MHMHMHGCCPQPPATNPASAHPRHLATLPTTPTSLTTLPHHTRRGSYGIILNRPTEYCLKDVTEGGSPLSPEFESCLLHMGGDVGGSELQMLHGMAGLEGAVEVGVWLPVVDVMFPGLCMVWWAWRGWWRWAACCTGALLLNHVA